MKILVTGVAGFIGFHVARYLLARGDEVIGLDNLNPYYDVRLKQARLAQLGIETGEGVPSVQAVQVETGKRVWPRRSSLQQVSAGRRKVKAVLPGRNQGYGAAPAAEAAGAGEGEIRFYKLDLANRAGLQRLFDQEKPQRVIHLAAQAGVRYSITNPHAYVESNLVGFMNILEECRRHRTEHLTYASSSSVYGANTRTPFSVGQNVDHPISLYAASKKANELMAHTYSHLYHIPTTGLRFFTVYGPWGRPDMAMFIFSKAILEGRSIDVFNYGEMMRDFTYIDDVVEGVVRTSDLVARSNPAWDGSAPDPASSKAPYRIYNIGNNNPVRLLHMIECLEDALGQKARRKYLPMQPGDVPVTCADVDTLARDVGFQPRTPIEEGIKRFVSWFREYYSVSPSALPEELPTGIN
jgi:UDP-glucuronate 4-epimerase